jgi:NADPH2:quinone reductase
VKTVVIRRTGGPKVLEIAEAPRPLPGPGQVLVRAAAIGVGWPDVLIRSGVYVWMPPLPTSPGSDMAGYVEEVGAGVTVLRPGQKVLITARDLEQRGGCYAEYIAVPAEAPHPLPDTVDLDQAVALPNYQVAWALLHEAARGRPINSVFITGAAGGVGSAATQLAKHAGLTTFGSISSPDKAAFARGQGLDHVIDYKRENVTARVLELTGGHGVDLILDHVAGPGFTENLKMLAPWGTLVSYATLGGLPEKDLFREMRRYVAKCIAVRSFSIHVYDHDRPARRAIMSTIIKLLGDGAIKPAIGARLKLDQAAQAHAMVERGAAMGKVILVP